MHKHLILLNFLIFLELIAGCQPQARVNSSTSTSSTSSTSLTSVTATNFSFASNDAVQIFTQTGALGSFTAATPPSSGGLSITNSRLFNLDGTVMTTPPSWFVSASVFLTSTRTQAGGNPNPPSGNNTPCAYFATANDENPDSGNRFYTISGFAPSLNANVNYIDQCAGTNVNELGQVGIAIQVNRSFMNTTDKFMVTVKARPINNLNTALNSNTCTVGGMFSAASCTQVLYALSMRQQPGATPLLVKYLFPSAKAQDLLTESVLVPIHTQPTYTTISIDRIKGGAVFYGITITRLP